MQQKINTKHPSFYGLSKYFNDDQIQNIWYGKNEVADVSMYNRNAQFYIDHAARLECNRAVNEALTAKALFDDYMAKLKYDPDTDETFIAEQNLVAMIAYRGSSVVSRGLVNLKDTARFLSDYGVILRRKMTCNGYVTVAEMGNNK
jgi:hypothetical protein